MAGYNQLASDGAPIKAWTKGLALEEKAEQQLRNIASLPFIHSHVAAMPAVGLVIPAKGVIFRPRSAAISAAA